MREKLNKEAFVEHWKTSIKYDDSYFLEFKKRALSEMGRKLYLFRKAYVECFSKEGKILDYGTGYGDLVYKDVSGRWVGFDVMKETQQRLGSKFLNSSWESFSNICLFDVFEHFDQPSKFLNQVKSGCRLFVTIPLWNGNWDKLSEIENWKHWKPGEHFFYASLNGFIEFFEKSKFNIIDYNKIESSLGREDCYTFCFSKV